MAQQHQVVKKYPHGTFSWVDLSSTDQSAAANFYKQLFGWSSVDVPIDADSVYTMFQIDGHTVAAVSAMQPEMQAQGMPSLWNSYVTVDDVEAVTKRAAEAGGTVIAQPFDVMGEGRMSVIQDPTGAVVSAWQPLSHIGASLVNIPGALNWNELRTPDAAKAGAFYSEVFGWTMQEDEGPNAYTMFVNDGRLNAGMVEMDESWGPMPPHWTPYFAVENTDAILEKAQELGGTVLVPAVDIPAGRFAAIQDPTGATFSIIQSSQVDSVPNSWM